MNTNPTTPEPGRVRFAAVLIALLLLLAACGGDDDGVAADATPAAAETQVEPTVDDNDGTDDNATSDATDDNATSDATDDNATSDDDSDGTDDTATDDDADGTDDNATDDDGDHSHDDGDADHDHDHEDGDRSENAAGDYTGSYELIDESFGTITTVTVDGDTRTIETNALPDHETGEFPNAGNPNAISAQDLTWEFPATGTSTGVATDVRTVGVALNGVKFEPDTAETVTCSSGETYRVEAIQELWDLGLDFNNAHVQPTGEYHYHGVSELLVDAHDTGEDLVHIGFAADGNLIYYSVSGAYDSGYRLSDEARTGTDCVGSGALGGEITEVDGTAPDGSFKSDWVWSVDTGDLDACNGIEIDGEYLYVLTDEYPYIGRCVMGEAAADAAPLGGGAPGGGAAPGGGGQPPASPPASPQP